MAPKNSRRNTSLEWCVCVCERHRLVSISNVHIQEGSSDFLHTSMQIYSEDFTQCLVIYAATTHALSWRVYITRLVCALGERHLQLWISRVHRNKSLVGFWQMSTKIILRTVSEVLLWILQGVVYSLGVYITRWMYTLLWTASSGLDFHGACTTRASWNFGRWARKIFWGQ